MQKRLIVIFGILLLLLMPFIHADIAPYGHRAASLDFLVKYDNQPIEEEFRADIIVCSEESCRSDNVAACIQGRCSFYYYRIERVPHEISLQATLNGKTFTSGAFGFSEKRPLLDYYYDVNINPDGNMTISSGSGEIEQHNWYDGNMTITDNNGVIAQNSYYRVLRLFAYALALTILIELTVLILFLRRWKVKGWKMPVLSLVLADVISVPLVWVIFLGIAAVLASVFLAIVVAEAFAVVFEAYALFFFNKKILSLKKSFILSIVMNAASFVVGVILAFLIIL